LLESELFGHEKGAFTGADKTRAGRFEQANGGTVFLDEIGEMSPALQAKLLRVLEEKSFERLGGNRTIHSDVRIIAATNRNLEEQVAHKTFREDLYYRINVIRFHLPPLRERQECIESFAYHLLEKICRSVKKQIDGFAPEVMDSFKRYSWPGNIRELSNTIERAVLLEDSRIIQKESVFLPDPLGSPDKKILGRRNEGGSSQTLDEHEKDLIIEALEQSLWIQKDAAERLGLTPRTLNYKIKRYGITHPRWRKNK
jgi:transcriptional regulator with GAF, ATPase, and Fis domain